MKYCLKHDALCFLPIAFLAVVAAGCANDGGDSPENVFSKLQNAIRHEDYHTAYGCYTADAQDRVVAQQVILASITGNSNSNPSPEMQDLFEKYRLQKVVDNVQDTIRENPGESFKEIASKIDNKRQFFCDFMDVMNSSSNVKRTDKLEGQLKDVQIDNETATGVIVSKNGQLTVKFAKENGRWKINPFTTTGPIGL